MVSARRLGEVVAGSLPNRTTTVTMGVATHPMENFVIEWIIYGFVALVGLGLIIRVLSYILSFFVSDPNTAKALRGEKASADKPAKSISAQDLSEMPVTGNADLIIRYRDNSNQETERRITPKKVRGSVNRGQLQVSHIEAYCHARKRSRTFKPERILQAADAETGEVLTLPEGLAGWFKPRISV
jgi:hypothetical protein